MLGDHASITSSASFRYDIDPVPPLLPIRRSHSNDKIGMPTGCHGVSVAGRAAYSAVVMASGKTYSYDANGNMTVRREKLDGISYVYTQTWTIDNRLASVTKTDLTGTVLAVTKYAYDGEGVRVRKVLPRACRGDDPDGTTLYAGPVEQTIGPGGTATAEYFDDISGTSTLTAFVATRSETVTAGLQQTFTVLPAGLGSEPYGVRYQIWLTVPTTDTYRLAVYADDGFILNGQGLTDTNTTTRGPTTTEAYRELTLLPNTIYNFGLTYLNYSAATTNTLQLLWRKGGGALEVVPVAAIHARGRRDYYSFGGVVVAVKEGVISTAPRVLTYLHGDHLGSTSLTTNASGQKVSEQRYRPYGEVRWSSGAGMPTDFTFTGQRASSYGTIFMSAREYLPSLGRFLSADSIVPGAGNPQALNRYAYVFNSPLRYVDPSGHDPLDQAWLDAFRAAHGRDPSDEDRQLRLYTLTRRGPISGGVDWSAADWAEFGRQGRNYWFGRLEAEMTRRSLSDFVGEIRNLARYYVSTETDSFVSAIALLYAGIPYDNRGGQVVAQGFGNGARIAVSTCPAGAITCLWLDHGSYGFGRHVTNNDREENTHHYAGHLLAGYWLGTAVNTVGAFIREIGEGLREGHGLDTADTQMAEVAGRHGAMLRGALVDIDPSRRQISPADLAALISVDLSPR